MDDIFTSDSDFQEIKISVLNKLSRINYLANESNVSPKKEITKPIDLLEENSIEIVSITSNKNSPQAFLKTLEIQRRKVVVNNVQARLQKFEDFTKQQEENRKKQWLKKQQEFVEDIQQKEDNIFQALEEYDKSSSNNHAQLALYYKNLELRRQQQENELKKREKERQVLYECIEKIKKLQPSFRNVYEQILPNLKRCAKMEELKTMLAEEFKLLSELRHNFEGVINKCKSGKVIETDVENAYDIFSQLQKLERKICQSVDEINARVEQEKIPKVQIEASIEPQPLNVNYNAVGENAVLYTKLMDFFDRFLESFKSLEKDPSQKQFILECKQAVNIPVNSLSGFNSEHIFDKYNRLYKLLKGEEVTVINKKINAASHPQGVTFCTYLLAKKFLQQSDLIISSNPESAFCYATVIMSLWNEFPVFGQLILAYFYKACPYLAPYHIERQDGESDEEYYKRQGYLYEDGQIEKHNKYLKRMTGLMHLYAAIMIVKPKKGHTNIYNIQNGWKWLAWTFKLEPQIDITATLVHTLLNTVGFQLEAHYGKMFQKIIRIIAEKFIPVCRQKCTGGAVTRLELLMTEYYKKSKFKTPDGYLDYNYW